MFVLAQQQQQILLNNLMHLQHVSDHKIDKTNYESSKLSLSTVFCTFKYKLHWQIHVPCAESDHALDVE